MRTFIPLICGIMIGASTIVHGQQGEVGSIQESQSQSPMNATQEIQLLNEKIKDLELMVEWQRAKINKLEQENWQMYRQLRLQNE